MQIVLISIFIYLLINVLYYLFFMVAARLIIKKPKIFFSNRFNKIGILIPAYKEDSVIIDSAKQALAVNYPKDMFEVIVIADSCQPDTLKKLSEMPVKTIVASFEKSSKSKALNLAFQQIDGFDIALVLDADNIMDKDFLSQINAAYNAGHKVIQGMRIAKNTNTDLASLDGISENINNLIFRKGHQAVGLSSALIGSGMAFDFHLFKKTMSTIDALGGFDKELELKLLKAGKKIHYAEAAVVYDEKVSHSQNFSRQRTRWIAAQLRYGFQYIGDAFSNLILKGNVDYFNKALQFVLLPRLILLGILGIFWTASLLPFVSAAWWLSYTLLLGAGSSVLLMGLTKQQWSVKTLGLALKLPWYFVLMVYASFGYKKAAKNFLHTSHFTTSNS